MTPLQIAKACEDLLDRTRSLNIRDYETCEIGQLLQELAPRLLELVSESLLLLHAILVNYQATNVQPAQSAEAGAPESAKDLGSFGRSIDEMMEHQRSRDLIVDLTAMARMEMQQQKRDLSNLIARRDSDNWRLIWICSIASGRLVKAVAAIGLALCQHENIPNQFDQHYLSERHQGLSVRKAYGKFRHIILGGPEPDEFDVQNRLQTAAGAFAKLVGHSVYEYTRVTDRIQFRKLQWQTISWLRGKDGFNAQAGLKLWQDLMAFTQLLSGINNRAEIREHDRTVLDQIHKVLYAGDAAGRVPEVTMAMLRSLEGLDDELDKLLSQPSPTIGLFRETISRLIEPFVEKKPPTLEGEDSF